MICELTRTSQLRLERYRQIERTTWGIISNVRGTLQSDPCAVRSVLLTLTTFSIVLIDDRYIHFYVTDELTIVSFEKVPIKEVPH